MRKITTLDEWIIKSEPTYSDTTGQLTRLLRDLGIAAKIINREVNLAGLVNILGLAQSENVSGDEVKKLDVFANERMIECLTNSGEVCAIASEELDDFIHVPPVAGKESNYIVVMDPLDGSSNIDVNVSVGTIFSIFRRKTPSGTEAILSDVLQKGSEIIAAGYVLYGTSTMLVYTTGNGVNGFTLDPSIGEFCLSHPDIKIPSNGNYYSVNQGYYLKFDLEMRRYIDHCSDKNLGLRYIGSMVSDIHRIMVHGGIFLYPSTRKYPGGKLRLLYECAPMAMIVEQAGGIAIDCDLNRILDLQPVKLHDRCTVVMGSPEMVDEMQEFTKKYSAR